VQKASRTERDLDDLTLAWVGLGSMIEARRFPASMIRPSICWLEGNFAGPVIALSVKRMVSDR